MVDIRHGDVLERLTEISDASVQCVVTSPPYWKLRDYGVPGQLGLEPTLEAYVTKMVEVFREVRRVLRNDGTCWLNIGDRFKSKNLMGIPWRLAFALQADGWYLRADIIWAKGLSFCDSYSGSVMPESVTDRPTKGHEYLFLLTKSPRYFYDAEAVREASTRGTIKRLSSSSVGPIGKNRKAAITRADGGGAYTSASGRNLRSVWAIGTKPYKAAHFATFPPKLVEPCIKAGTSEKGCCAVCGAPWVREAEKNQGGTTGESWHDHKQDSTGGNTKSRGGRGTKKAWETYQRGTTTGWRSSCACDAETTPCTVLDPFVGSGTAGIVALRLSRKFIGIDLSEEYCRMARERIVGPLFSELS